MDTPEVGFTNVWKIGCDIERELNAANAEIRSLKYNIERVMGMYTSKDNQICNLLNICRVNGVDVSSHDLIYGKEDKL
tara:strand:- start:279 stop:512 length:234 start_codon:yes stop_codon:yes gene_type:complete